MLMFFFSENSNGLNSSTSLRQSASKTTRSKLTTSQVSKKVTSTPSSPQPKDIRPSSATTTKPQQKRHLASNVPLSCSQQLPGKTSKTTTEARTASCKSVKSLESRNNAPNAKSKANITTVTRPASSQSVKNLESSGISKPSKDNVLNTANEASQRISQLAKRPDASPTLKRFHLIPLLGQNQRRAGIQRGHHQVLRQGTSNSRLKAASLNDPVQVLQ